jgi:hypothetical protein
MRKQWIPPLLLLGLAAALVRIDRIEGQTRPSASAVDPPFEKSVLPVLTANCVGCHNAKQAVAGLNLEDFPDTPSAARRPEVWSKVREKLSAGQMPPAGLPAPNKQSVAAAIAWIDHTFPPVRAAEAAPGRVMARRLNRVEYNNTIRDLLGVPVRPADEFPVDDSGYGFDNIGDVLSVSPMLLEKYMAAAARVSQLAIFGAPLPDKPTRLIRLLNRRSPDVNDVANGSYAVYLPYSMRGAMYGNWIFPADAEYEFRLRIANFRTDRTAPRRAGRGPLTAEDVRAQEEAARLAAPPRKLVLTVDGVPTITAVVEGTTTFGYDRGEFTARVPVRAGSHLLRASFPELADLDDPRQNINPDMRRALFVDYLDIVGPFNASQEPPASYKRVFVCGHAPGHHQAECAPKAVESVMRRAYRRPVTREEVEGKLRLFHTARKEGESIEESVQLALQAILVSPDFLFHIERDPKAAGVSSHPVGEHELASRLSYFLWSSMPDEELSRAADLGQLRKPGALEKQVRRMMADPKSSNLVNNFAAQWLQLRNLGRTKPDPKRFPTVDDELLDAMRRETSLFLQAVISEDRSILDLIDAPFTFVNGMLARHYGIRGVNGEEFQRIPLDGVQRSGILTQGSILTLSSYPTRTSPPVRGKWVLENLLGSAPPPPPPNIPVLNEANLGKTVSLRERMEQHRKDPSCSICHNRMDPIGFGLESYDGAGAWRTKDGEVAIDPSGVLPDGQSFRGAQDLKQILKGQSDAFTRNLVEKMLTFALARGLEPSDRVTVDEIVRHVAENHYRFSSLVFEVINSKPFQMRNGESGGKG